MKYVICFLFLLSCEKPTQYSLVLQSDFGEKDGAVSAMRGVAKSVSSSLDIYDLTHEIPVYNTWEASYRLGQTVNYWPEGTVFVSVVDPGVGTKRKSVVLKTKSNHFIVTPDNGTLTHVAEQLGIAEIREIDEVKNRLKNSEASYTFHGRDVYSYTGARLASNTISFEEVGPKLESKIVSIPYTKAELKNNALYGGIPILDPQYGNVWTNIPKSLLEDFNFEFNEIVTVEILNANDTVLTLDLPYSRTFGDVSVAKPLMYLNSLNHISFALNMSNFAKKYQIQSGANWRVMIKKKSIQ